MFNKKLNEAVFGILYDENAPFVKTKGIVHEVQELQQENKYLRHEISGLKILIEMMMEHLGVELRTEPAKRVLVKKKSK